MELNINELKKYCNPSYITIRKDKLIVNNRRLAKLSRQKINQIEKDFNIPVVISKSYEEVSQKMGRYISKKGIISPKDAIIVGLSGGKDSLLLLHLLESYRRKFGISIYAITVDLNIDGTRPWKNNSTGVKLIKNHCDNLQIPHKVISFDDNIVELSNILSQNTKGMEYSPCFSCSVIRRHVLTKYAHDLMNNNNLLKLPKICFGHTLDDNSDTVLANIFKGDIIRVLEPIKNFDETTVNFGDKKIQLKRSIIIRPMLNIYERDILKALSECGITYYNDKDMCPYSRNRGDSIRKKSHEIIQELEKDVKNIREMIVSSVIKSIDYYKKG